MTAPVRRDAATRQIQHWLSARPVRDEWVAVGTATAPADRAAAETLIAGIYARHHRDRPAFRWVESPRQALPLTGGMPTHEVLQGWVLAGRPQGTPPVASDIAAGLARLRGALDDSVANALLTATQRPRDKADRHKPWPVLPPEAALEAGVPLREVLRQSLHTPLAAGLIWPVRQALGPSRSLPVCWYGQHDAVWIGLYDMLRRIGLAVYGTRDHEEFEQWAQLALVCGWWWPGEDVCVIADRPASVAGRSIRYRDGTVITW